MSLLVRLRRPLTVAVVAAAFLALLLQLSAGARQLSIDPARIRPEWLALATALTAASYAATALLWARVLDAVGAPLPAGRAFRLMYAAELGKYLPGKVWGYLGQFYLGRREGLGPARLALANGVLLAVQTGVAALIVAGAWLLWRDPAAVAARPLELAALASIALAGLALVHPRPLRLLGALAARVAARLRPSDTGERVRDGAPVTAATALRLVALSLVAWLVAGAATVAFVAALVPIRPADAPLIVAGYAASWVAGYYAVVAPGGLGVRELAQAQLLGLILEPGDAAVIAIALRLWLIAGDLVAGAVAWRLAP